MKLSAIVERYSEVVPSDKERSAAATIAMGIVRNAEYQGRGNPERAKKIAHEMADKFHSSMLAAIDHELGYKQIKDVHEVV